jgi:signal peptidase I
MLHDGQTVSINTGSYRLDHPRRGDIVVFKSSGYSPPESIKRVIGLPGEVVAVHGGMVHIDGHLLREPYVPAGYGARYVMRALKVPRHAVFVLGDNRNNSYDSHSWGPLAEKLIIGEVRLAP